MIEAMWHWLLSPIAEAKIHDISPSISWHGRLMVLAWGIMIPSGIFIARYVKVTPKQKWPQELDNKFWWYSHLLLQNGAGILMLFGFVLVAKTGLSPFSSLHHFFGLLVLIFAASQIVSGYLRGTKGGPTDRDQDGSMFGDHYNMTKRRRVFEAIHIRLGYTLLVAGSGTILLGLWQANAPRWMWICIILFWVLLGWRAKYCERRGHYVSSYAAIWGKEHDPMS